MDEAKQRRTALEDEHPFSDYYVWNMNDGSWRISPLTEHQWNLKPDIPEEFDRGVYDSQAKANAALRRAQYEAKPPLIDWDEPEERLALIQRVGPEVYSRELARRWHGTVVDVVNGHEIRPLKPSRAIRRFVAQLFVVEDNAFPALTDARTHALLLPRGEAR